MSSAPILGQAVVSFQTTASFGYYKDIRQKPRFPFYTTLAYQGVHDQGVETSFQLLLNNDFGQNAWRFQPAYASVLIPISSAYPSQVEAGRFLLTEGFDMTLLDGVQSPIYWSHTGGVFLYGGATRSLDLFDESSGAIVGSSLFEEFYGFKLRGGWSGRDTSVKRQSVNASLFRSFPSLPWNPNILLKQEWGMAPANFSQSLSEILFYPNDALTFSAAYSYREPRPYTELESDFIYRLFSVSPQQIQEYALTWQATQSMKWNLKTKWTAFNSGVQKDRGEHQDLSANWLISGHSTFTPSVSHIKSYGGEVWNPGFRYDLSVTEKLKWIMEYFAAHIDKVNNIQGWAHHVRSGINYYLASHTTTVTWFEIERNHRFEFDGRVMAYVTQYY